MLSSDSNSFYLTLSSDSSSILYPQNRTGKFRTNLASTIYLDGCWEVALSEIHYTNNWVNLRERALIEFSFQHYHADEKEDDPLTTPPPDPNRSCSSTPNKQRTKSIDSTPPLLTFQLAFEKGSYRSAQAICNLMTKMISNKMIQLDSSLKQYLLENKYPVEVRIDPNTELLYVSCLPSLDVSIYTVESKELLKCFGVKEEPTGFYEVPLIGTNAVNLLGTNLAFYVVSNVVKYQYVSDTQLQLLRLVPIKAREKVSDRVHQLFDKPHYVPVSVTALSSIEIGLCFDDACKSEVIFPSASHSKIIVCLHFRRCGI